jgi:ABC-type sugar transport system permease subunit
LHASAGEMPPIKVATRVAYRVVMFLLLVLGLQESGGGANSLLSLLHSRQTNCNTLSRTALAQFSNLLSPVVHFMAGWPTHPFAFLSMLGYFHLFEAG